MPQFVNLTSDTAGTDEADTFTFSQPVVPASGNTLTVLGGNGFDRLEVLPGALGRSFYFTLGAGQYGGTVISGGKSLIASQFEQLAFTGSDLADVMNLEVKGDFSTLDVMFDGGAGDDTLGLDARDRVGDFAFLVDGAAITSSAGQFANFENFIITLGNGSDRVTTGNGNDTVFASIGNQQATGFDTVFTAGGDDIVQAYSAGSYDGGDGFDLFNGFFAGILVRDYNPLTLVADGIITLSNGTTIANFEKVEITTSRGDDTIDVRTPIFGRIHGGEGVDTFIYNTGSDEAVRVSNASIVALSELPFPSANATLGFDVEIVRITTGAGDDQFLVGGLLAYPGYFDAGGGTDSLEFRAADAARFDVRADGTVDSNLGTFIGFEIYALYGSTGADHFVAGPGNDYLYGDQGDDYLAGGAGNDVLTGDYHQPVTPFLSGFLDDPGVNTMLGGPGDDTYYVFDADDTIVELAGEGIDTVHAFRSFSLANLPNVENLYAYDDGSTRFVSAITVEGNAGDNHLTTIVTGSVLIGRMGADWLQGGTGIDTASFAGDPGGVFVNLTLGRGYTNSSFGDVYESIENVVGTDYDDFLIGDAGVNRLEGGAGNDTIIGAVGADELVGGAGSDLLSYEDNSGVVFVNMLTAQGFNNAAQGDMFEGFENVVGGLFDDTLIGDDGANRIDGALGADTLAGNGGADTFVFKHAPGAASGFANPNSSANVDTIIDFTSGEDKIEIAAASFGGGLTPGALNAGALVVGMQAQDADDRLIYDQDAGRLYFDADGSGAGAQVLMALLPNHNGIAASDFVVV